MDGDNRDLHLLTHSFPTRRSSDLGDNWAWTLAHTQSRMDIERRNFFGPSPVGPAFENRVLSNHDVGATELEVEGAVFSLPGGDARLAFGAERRTEELFVDQGDFGTSR